MQTLHVHSKEMSHTYNIFPLTKLHLETIISPYKYFKTFQDGNFFSIIFFLHTHTRIK